MAQVSFWRRSCFGTGMTQVSFWSWSQVFFSFFIGLRLAQPQPIQCGSPGTYLSLKDWGPCHDTESGGARSRRLYTLPWLFSTHGY